MGWTKRIVSATVGFALYLSINAISIWGGFFPLIPTELQSSEILVAFFVSQAVSFSGMFLLSAFLVFRRPHLTQQVPPGVFSGVVCAGSACIISSMYLQDYAVFLVIAGGILLGSGCAGLFIMWQRVFSSIPVEQGNMSIILGTAAAPFIYSAVNFAPEAIAAFLVPLFLAPLCGTCLSIAQSGADFHHPMFEDEPSKHFVVYTQVAKDHWRSALCFGCFGFASGIVRGVAVLEEKIAFLINEAALFGMLVSAAIMLTLCCLRRIKVDPTSVFRIAFPALITGFLFVPYLGAMYLTTFVALTYFGFSLIQMLMMLQSAQISHNRGINPLFTFGFFAGVAYIMQSIGFSVGWFGTLSPGQASAPLLSVSQISMFVLGISLFVVIGSSFKESLRKGSVSSDPIELFLPANISPFAESISKTIQRAETSFSSKRASSRSLMDLSSSHEAPIRSYSFNDKDLVKDMISIKCHVIKERFSLSLREFEIAELVVRGYSAPAIAKRLVISEHTVKTHMKHIYTKLEIHRKQELLDLVDSVDLS